MTAIGRGTWIALCIVAVLTPARAQLGDNTRGWQILENRPVEAESMPVLNAPTRAMMIPQVPKAENPAGVTLEILPSSELSIGAKIKLRIATKKTGFLVVVDVDATGKVTQMYPNPGGSKVTGGGDTSNRIRAGQPITVPQHYSPDFLARPPPGAAMIVAILSNRPVQVFDLPDVPSDLAGRAEALRYLTDAAGMLRIAGTARSGQFAKPQLSFDAKFYVIK